MKPCMWSICFRDAFIQQKIRWNWLQREQIEQNVATFAKIFKSLAIFWQFISNLAKCWAYFGTFGTLLNIIVIIANGQILKNNLTIWSHYLAPTERLRDLKVYHRVRHLRHDLHSGQSCSHFGLLRGPFGPFRPFDALEGRELRRDQQLRDLWRHRNRKFGET